MTENIYDDIVYCTDDNYCLPTVVSIQSLIECVSNDLEDNRFIVIHVIVDSVSKKNLEILSALATRNIKINIINFEDYKFLLPEDLLVLAQDTGAKHVSRTSFIKFVIPRILINSDKALYLDGDTLILNDIRSILRTNIDHFYGAVVVDFKVSSFNKLAHVRILRGSYFNSGVMLLNLKKLRELGVDRRLIAYRICGENKFQDQDAFNDVFNGRVKYLSPYNNYLIVYEQLMTLWQKIYFFEQDVPDTWEERLEHIKILHLAGPIKPWKIRVDLFTDLFLKFYSLSPYQRIYKEELNLGCIDALSGSNSSSDKNVGWGKKKLFEFVKKLPGIKGSLEIRRAQREIHRKSSEILNYIKIFEKTLSRKNNQK